MVLGDRGFPYYTPIIDRLVEMGLPIRKHYVEADGHSWEFWDETLRDAVDKWLPIHHDVL